MKYSKGERIVNTFYAVESGETGEGPFVSFSITITAKDWAMYKAIAERFGTTIKSLVASNLYGSAEDMFLALSDEDKEKAIASSQAYYHEQLAKAQIQEVNGAGEPTSPWRTFLETKRFMEAQGIEPEDLER